jgi:sulfatase modifying factor 1
MSWKLALSEAAKQALSGLRVAKDIVVRKAVAVRLGRRLTGLAQAIGGFVMDNQVSVPGMENKIATADNVKQQIQEVNQQVGQLTRGLIANRVGLAAVGCLILVICGLLGISLQLVHSVRDQAPKPEETQTGVPTSAKYAPSTSLALGKVLENSLGMKLVYIPDGEFLMGSHESAEELARVFKKYNADIKPEYFADEYPQHPVRITNSFYLGAHEATVGQFRQFVNDSKYKTDAEQDGKGGYGFDGKSWEQKPEYTWRDAGFPQTDEHPVVNVSWNDADAFCRWLSKTERQTYRLPTEAEWEYACRAGTQTRYCNGDDPEGLARVGNVADAAAKAKFSFLTWAISASDGYVFTAPVGQFKPNAWGLYDTHGNALEWCADWYDAKHYGKSRPDKPNGSSSGTSRVLRGGAWDSRPSGSRSAFRDWDPSDYRDIRTGFRVSRTL